MSLHIGKKLCRGEDRATASEVVAALVDLLTEILVRLPAKSLLRFKSVSKKWLSLISSRRFCVLRSKRCCKHIRGLLLQGHFEDQPLFDFIPLHPGQIAPFESLKDGLGAVEVIQYCNGLLLCRSNFYPDFATDHKLVCKYYVFNPTTRQQTAVNVNRFLEDSGKYNRPNIVNLAFDPRISPHYKLICSYMTITRGRDPKYQYMFGVYSSESGLMTRVSNHLHTDAKLLTTQGIYWNGAIIWMAHTKESFHFNVDKMCFKKILYLNVDERLVGMLPLPPVADVTEGAEFEFGMYMTYFGVSNDHFYLIQTSKMYTLQFNVYDLDREYSGWFVRFRVDLQPVLRSFPQAVEKNIWKFAILAIVEKADDDDEKPFLVLSIRGKAIRFYLKDGSCTKICDFRAMNVLQKLPFYKCHDSIQLVESLHPLPL